MARRGANMGFASWKIGTRLVIAFGGICALMGVMMGVTGWLLWAAENALQAGGATELAEAAVQRVRWWVWGLGAGVCALALLAWVSLRQGIVYPLQQAILIAETVAAGDLSQEFSSNLEGDFGRLLSALGTMEDTLTELVGRIHQSSVSISVSAAEIDGGNVNLSRRTDDQVAALTETAASMEQLTVTVRQNADRARSASGLAVGASATAERGGVVVGEVVQTMEAISGSSRKIVDIIQVIEGIAFQTNILALNAAVEAARAGDQGRGFAVVASEVRSLAGRSAEAAKQVKALITASVDQVESGSVLVGQAGKTMQEIVGSVGQVTGLLGEISQALQEQSEGIAQVNQAVAHMDGATQENASLVSQAGHAAQALSARAQDLQEAVGAFKLEAEEAQPVAAGQHVHAEPQRMLHQSMPALALAD